MNAEHRLRIAVATVATILVAVGTFVLLEVLVPGPASSTEFVDRVSPVAVNVEERAPEPVPTVGGQEQEQEKEKEKEAVILTVLRPTVTNPPGDPKRYRKAVKIAMRQGFDGLLETQDDAQLWQLADDARYSGRGELARNALLAIRRRFQGSWRAKVAAFLLGRIAVEVQGDPGQAARWFMICLREDPSGRLAEEALGRRIYTCREAGLKAESCRVAAKYLGLYPQGTFSEYARSVLRYKPSGKESNFSRK